MRKQGGMAAISNAVGPTENVKPDPPVVAPPVEEKKPEPEVIAPPLSVPFGLG